MAARTFKTHAMARIWEGQRYAPPATLARLAAHAEEFAAQVAPMQSYPESLVEERITHYRGDGPGEGDVLAGDALRADLAAFVELATARAPLPRDIRGGALSMRDAAARLGVSLTTLKRYRDRGLLTHHVETPTGRASSEVCVFSDVLADFAASNATLVLRASNTGRVTKEVRAELTAQALEQLQQQSASVNALANKLATSTGRSTRTVRRILQGSTEVGARVRGGTRTRAAAGAAHTTAIAAARAWHMGVSPQELAARNKASVAACIRSVQRGRVLELRAALAHTAPLVLPTFSRSDAAATLLAPPSVRTNLPCGDWVVPAPRLASGSKARGQDAHTAAVIAHHFLMWRAAQCVRGSRRPDSPVLDAAERDLRWAYRLRRSVVQAALPDALARVAQSMGSPWKRVPVELQMRWAAAAVRAAAQALDFRALASVAIDDVHPLRSVAHAVEMLLTRQDLDALIAQTPPVLDGAAIAPWVTHLETGDRWAAALPSLSSAHRAIVARRFGLDGAPPATIEELAPLVRGSSSVAQGRVYQAMASVRAWARGRA